MAFRKIARLCLVVVIFLVILAAIFSGHISIEQGGVLEPQVDATLAPTSKNQYKIHDKQTEYELLDRANRVKRHPFFRALTGRCVTPKELQLAGYRRVGRVANSGCPFPNAVRYDALTLYDYFLRLKYYPQMSDFLHKRSIRTKTYYSDGVERKCFVSSQCPHDSDSTHCSRNVYEKCSTSWWFNNINVGWVPRKCSKKGTNYFIASRDSARGGNVVLECYLGNAAKNYKDIKQLMEKGFLKEYLRRY